jgi:chromosome segregation ATPase
MDYIPDKTFGMRYANLVAIFKCLSNYLDQCPDKVRFIKEGINNLKSIKINELLKNDENELMLLTDYIIVLTSVSSRVNLYLDRLENEEVKLVNTYYEIFDKYISQNDGLNASINSLYSKPSEELKGHRLSLSHLDKLNRRVEDLLREKDRDSKLISVLEKELERHKKSSKESENQLSQIDMKYKDCQRELEHLKRSSKTNILAQEELLRDSIEISNLKNSLQHKEIEIEDIKRNFSLQIKSLNETLNVKEEKIEKLEDRLEQAKATSAENEKLKTKIKDLMFYKDRQSEYDELTLNIETKNRKIDSLLKEKQNLIIQIENGNKEILAEKDKTRLVDFDKKRLDSEIKEWKKNYAKLELRLKDTLLEKDFDDKKISLTNSPKESGKYLIDLDLSNDNTDAFEVNSLKSENNNLKTEIKKLKDDYNLLLSEKEKLYCQIELNSIEMKKIINDNDKVILEREKLNLKIQKIELDYLKNEMKLKEEKKILEEDLKDLQEKINKVSNEKILLLNLAQEFKKDFSDDKIKRSKINSVLDKITDENETMYSSNKKSKSNLKENEMEELYEEIQNLKVKFNLKNEVIRNYFNLL